MNTNELKRKIMIRVYTLFLIRKLKKPITLEVLVFSASLLSFISMVSLGHVLDNTPHSIGGVYYFLIAAFLNTELLVKILILVMIFVTLVLIRNLVDYIYTNRDWLLARA